MAIKAAIWTHGHGVKPEREGAWLNTSRPGWGALFKTGGGSHWFHIHFSGPVLLNDQRLKLTKAFVMFESKNNATVEALNIYDGRNKVFTADNLALAGDHSTNLDNQNTWVINPPIEIKFGLGYSVLVKFAGGGLDVPEILFTSAGADFS